MIKGRSSRNHKTIGAAKAGVERGACAPFHFARLRRIVRITTYTAARIKTPRDNFQGLTLRQVQTPHAHLPVFRNDGNPLNHSFLGLLDRPRIERLGDAVEHISHRRVKMRVLKKLLDLPQIAARLEIKKGGRGWPKLGQAEAGQPVSLTEISHPPKRQSRLRPG